MTASDDDLTERLEPQPETILIIDDEEDFCRTLATRLELRGYTVFKAFNGQDGLIFFNRAQPDAVILDMRMPGLSGADVLEQIRKKNEKLPVILVTGHSSDSDLAKAKFLGIQGLHTKPIEFDEVLANLKSAIADSK